MTRGFATVVDNIGPDGRLRAENFAARQPRVTQSPSTRAGGSKSSTGTVQVLPFSNPYAHPTNSAGTHPENELLKPGQAYGGGLVPLNPGEKLPDNFYVSR